MKQPKILSKLGYAPRDPDSDNIDLVYKKAITDYKRAIMYYAGVKLWSNHKTAFREHKKYYGN